MTETAPELAGRSLIRNVKVAGKRMQARLNVSEPCFWAIIQDVPILNQPASFCLQHINAYYGGGHVLKLLLYRCHISGLGNFQDSSLSTKHIWDVTESRSVWLLCIPFDVLCVGQGPVREGDILAACPVVLLCFFIFWCFKTLSFSRIVAISRTWATCHWLIERERIRTDMR